MTPALAQAREGDSARGAMIRICAYDLCAAAAAISASVGASHALGGGPAPTYANAALSFVVCAAAAIWSLGIHRAVWRYTSLDDIVRLIKGAMLTCLLFTPALVLLHAGANIPFGAVLLAFPIFLTLMVSGRLVAVGLATGDLAAAFRRVNRRRPPALIIGASNDVSAALAAAQRSSDGMNFRPIGIIATDGRHIGRVIRGAPVMGGLADIDRAIEQLRQAEPQAPGIALVGPLTDRSAIEAALAAAGKCGSTVFRLTADRDAPRFLPVAPVDLLARPARSIDSTQARQLISGKRVLITGAGGTIGGELARQAAGLNPALLVLVDASERNLYEIDLEFTERFSATPRVAALGDVRDLARINKIFAQHKPQVVIHAAALKHVPLMETNAPQAILTNVGGLKTVADAAVSHGADVFVFISTDKAVNPSNVMGATKRVGELYLRGAAAAHPQIAWAAVRFGNVLGSAGSVAPLFERQIARGGPVTVTHPDITRYFMTVEEAAHLVLLAASHARASSASAGDVYVLDMGDPVRIEDLARQMIRLKGLEPDKDVKIVHTGLRPGEKIHEEIFYEAELVRQSGVDGVFIADTPAVDLPSLEPQIAMLLAAADRGDDEGSRAALHMLAPEFRAS